GVGQRHVLQEIERYAVRLVFEAAIAEAMARNIGAATADRVCGWAPQIKGFLVADVDRLPGRIDYGIVRPWRELVLAAVFRPGVAASLRRDLEAEAGIGDHVDPWRGRDRAVFEDRHIFTSVLVEAAEPVEELKRRHVRRRTLGELPHRP